MKVEFYEETTVQKKERYIADDGTTFLNEDQCRAYEEGLQLKDYPMPARVSVPLPDGDYDVRIALLKSALDFKKLRSRFTDLDDTGGLKWDVDCLDEPNAYPCAYVYYADTANRAAWNTATTPQALIDAYWLAARKLSVWCAQQLDGLRDETSD